MDCFVLAPRNDEVEVNKRLCLVASLTRNDKLVSLGLLRLRIATKIFQICVSMMGKLPYNAPRNDSGAESQ